MNDPIRTPEQLLQAAVTAHQSGRPEETRRICEQILAVTPGDENALHLAGLSWQAQRQFSHSLSLLEQARNANPNNPFIHYNLGVTMQGLNQLQAAEGCYREALRLQPKLAPASYNLGRLLLQSGRATAAESALRDALSASPQMPEAHLVLGNALKAQGRWEDAADAYAQAAALKSAYAEAHFNLAMAFKELGRYDEALTAFDRFMRLRGEDPQALNQIGLCLRQRQRYNDALAPLRRALELTPDFAGAWTNLGLTLDDLGRTQEAIESFDRALAVDPHLVEALYGKAVLLDQRGSYDLAAKLYSRALEINPELPYARMRLLRLRMGVCSWAGIADDFRDMLQRLENGQFSGFAFDALALPDATPAHHLRIALEHAARFAKLAATPRPEYSAHGGRLRIGYVSADFHEHATAYLAAGLFERHDRSQFEVFAYSMGVDDRSPMRKRLLDAFEHFTDIRELSHEQAAQRIFDDGIDILIDLKGYTQDARTEIFALRPAPLAVNWLGYPGSMGADFIDYVVVDPFVVPPEQAPFYTEKLAYLPHSYQSNDDQRPIDAIPTRAEAGLPDDAFVFCCFNNSYKITPDMFDIWCGLLAAVPGSVLWLLAANPWAEENLRREAVARGVEASRLIFAPKKPHSAHLARISLADLFLDTLPYNAHTTASDALWAGVPVVTCAGETFPSRVAGSLLRAVGLPELVTERLDQYRDLALRLATQPDELKAIRHKLAENRLTTPLFDSERFTRDFEALYRRMWARHEQGLPPDMLEPS